MRADKWMMRIKLDSRKLRFGKMWMQPQPLVSYRDINQSSCQWQWLDKGPDKLFTVLLEETFLSCCLQICWSSTDTFFSPHASDFHFEEESKLGLVYPKPSLSNWDLPTGAGSVCSAHEPSGYFCIVSLPFPGVSPLLAFHFQPEALSRLFHHFWRPCKLFDMQQCWRHLILSFFFFLCCSSLVWWASTFGHCGKDSANVLTHE